MNTKLETMVDLLAGREVDPALLAELADPSSEASRFLEGTRARSRALFAEPGPVAVPAPSHAKALLIAAGVIAGLALVAATFGLLDRRFRLLEATFEARAREARSDARRTEEALDRLVVPRPLAEPLDPLKDALGRIEADLIRLERRGGGAEAPKGDLGLAQVREDLASIRREILAGEKAQDQHVEELQAAVHDAARVLRLLLNRLDPHAPGPDPTPGLNNPPRPPAKADPRRPRP